MIIAAMVGTGLLGGTPVRELQGGALDADATLLAPAVPAFSIWSVIYVLMVGYAVWQALPGQRRRARQRRAGWLIAATAVFNGCWLLAAQYLNLVATVIAIVVLLAALGAALRVLVRTPPEGVADRLWMDLTVGLHLGWVSVATVANVTAWLAAEVVPPLEDAVQTLAALLVLVVVAVVGVALARGTRTARTRARVAPALAIAWGLGWIGVARLTGEPHSDAVGWCAIAVAVIVLAAPLVLGRRRSPR